VAKAFRDSTNPDGFHERADAPASGRQKQQLALGIRSMSTSRTRGVEKRVRRHLALPICFSILALLCLFGHRHAASRDQPPLLKQLIGGEFFYLVQKGDSLTGIGARFGVDPGVLAGGNNLSLSSRLQVGQELRVDNRHIVPNIPQQRRRYQYSAAHAFLF
jgi:LysM repeat protein